MKMISKLAIAAAFTALAACGSSSSQNNSADLNATPDMNAGSSDMTANADMNATDLNASGNADLNATSANMSGNATSNNAM